MYYARLNQPSDDRFTFRIFFGQNSMIDENPFSLFDEDEEDIEGSLSVEVLEDLQTFIVYNLDWTVETVLSQLRDNAIDLTPQYQRRDAWTIARKSKLIESLITGLPVPHIALAERPDAKGTFLILDGKQRLTTIAQFAGILPDSPFNHFALRDLPLLPHLSGVTYKDILESPELRQFKTAFLNQPLRTAILRGWNSDDLLHLVFHRLNSQVVPLSPQELRQALIRGPFMAFLNDYSARSETMQWLLNLDGPDFRMRDSELLLRLLALTKYTYEYRGDLRKFLDKLARKLSKQWDNFAESTEADLKAIEEAIELWGDTLGRNLVGRKYTEGRYEGRLNRAVLDAQVFAALTPELSERIRRSPEEVKSKFENLMTTDDPFRRAIEATTKSIEAVRYRMERLRDELLTINNGNSTPRKR